MMPFRLYVLFALLISFCGITQLHAQNQVVFTNLLDDDADSYVLKPGEKMVVQRKDGTTVKCNMVTADSSGITAKQEKDQPEIKFAWNEIAELRIPDGISREHWAFRAALLGGGVAVAALSYSLKLPGAVFLIGAAAAVAGLAGIIHGTVKLIVKKKIDLRGKGWKYDIQPDRLPQKINN